MKRNLLIQVENHSLINRIINMVEEEEEEEEVEEEVVDLKLEEVVVVAEEKVIKNTENFTIKHKNNNFY
jgi:hypothetical protein